VLRRYNTKKNYQGLLRLQLDLLRQEQIDSEFNVHELSDEDMQMTYKDLDEEEQK